MSKFQLKSIKEGEAVINIHVNLDPRGATGYEANIKLTNNAEQGFCPEWSAEMSFNGMPTFETPEEAVDRMGDYLKAMSKAMKGRNIKHINVGDLFKPKHK